MYAGMIKLEKTMCVFPSVISRTARNLMLYVWTKVVTLLRVLFCTLKYGVIKRAVAIHKNVVFGIIIIMFSKAYQSSLPKNFMYSSPMELYECKKLRRPFTKLLLY